MSTVDLMLLGILMKRPMNAYEMKKELDYRSIKDWIRISSPSVYKNLVKLYKSGYLDGKMIREGEMPEKMVYTINDKGKKHFTFLMEKYSEDPGTVYIDFAAFLSNLYNLDYKTGLKMIESLQNVLSYKRDCITAQYKNKNEYSFYAGAVIDLYMEMYNTFCTWLENFKKQYTEHNE